MATAQVFIIVMIIFNFAFGNRSAADAATAGATILDIKPAHQSRHEEPLTAKMSSAGDLGRNAQKSRLTNLE
jgi:hypothetical protein